MNNKNSNESKNQNKKQGNGVAFFNDQLGENASEEYKSEMYTNAIKNQTDKKEK